MRKVGSWDRRQRRRLVAMAGGPEPCVVVGPICCCPRRGGWGGYSCEGPRTELEGSPSSVRLRADPEVICALGAGIFVRSTACSCASWRYGGVCICGCGTACQTNLMDMDPFRPEPCSQPRREPVRSHTPPLSRTKKHACVTHWMRVYDHDHDTIRSELSFLHARHGIPWFHGGK